MTAVYGLPDHLIDAVAWGVHLAASIAEPDDGIHNGEYISDLAEQWDDACSSRNHHRDLLRPDEAAELLAVIELAAEYAETNNYAAEEDREDFPGDVEFALSSEEILFTLRDIAQKELVS